jgi:fucokinase
VIADRIGTQAGAPLIVDANLHGPLTARGAAMIVGLSTARPLVLEADTVLHQLPLADGYVTRIYGLDDDPKRTVDDGGATFMNRPWGTWLAEATVGPEVIWPGVPDHARTLWNARLYPVIPDRDESLNLSLPLQAPAEAPAGWRAQWVASQRLSLAESYVQAESEQILAELTGIEDEVAACRFYAAIEAERPAAVARPLLGTSVEAVARRAKEVDCRLQADDRILQLRGYKALAEATGEEAWETVAFRALAAMIEDAVGERWPTIQRKAQARQDRATSRSARVEASARIDFGGGWTDTPPYSIERGGTVLNAAVTLRGHYPIVAEAAWLSEPRLILESCDIDTTLELTHLGQVLAYANPADPFALCKAAIVLRGIVPAEGDPSEPLANVLQKRGGVRLCTQTNIPRGSGLGTSSIMGGAVLTCLGRLLGVELTPAELFDEVLFLEQMMTTGGGWQDQVGGLTGGIKLVTTAPGLPQRIHAAPVRLSADTRTALAERLLLVYTGQRRLAKNLLRAVMGRWMARDPEMVWIQGEIARLAVAMRDALEAGDVDGFGALLSEHWALNVRMDPGCSNAFIDALFEAMTPYVSGGKLAGAGGGGYAIVVARDEKAAGGLSGMLAREYVGTQTAVWPCAVPDEGMVCTERAGSRDGQGDH